MHIILFDDKRWQQLLPLTFTRPVADLRVGIDRISDKWVSALGQPVHFLTEPYLAEKFPVSYGDDHLYIYGGVIPEPGLLSALGQLKGDQALVSGDEIIAVRTAERYLSGLALLAHAQQFTHIQSPVEPLIISRPWHIFQYNDVVLRRDFDRITSHRPSLSPAASNTLIGHHIFIEAGARVEACVLNASTGPIYIGRDAEVMEGSMIRGPFALCAQATVKMGTKIYGPTTIGPGCKVGGEINNSVFQANSNKAHDGFIGNSVIGEWCNLGADTNCSNLKNNYAPVKLWDYQTQKFIPTGLQFCGLIMADHSKCGINTMFNTGTVVGVHANIFGDGFPRNFIPSFSWGGASGFVTYTLRDAFATTSVVMARRNLELDLTDRRILTTIYELSEKYRKGQLIFLNK